ncbi:MAG: S24/S26 family peptidase [Clostridia bacterium]|nr:S24/S26 family peptidase [Clostridia bacterium]
MSEINKNATSPDYKTSLEKHGFLAFVPRGNSMWPTLKNAKQSVVLMPKSKRLKRMDVAMYMRDDKTFVLHRVIEVKDDGYVFCGDSMPMTLKEYVREDQVFGVMVGYYKRKRYISAEDDAFILRGEKLYKHEKCRLLKVKIANFLSRVKNKLKRILSFKRVKKKNIKD